MFRQIRTNETFSLLFLISISIILRVRLFLDDFSYEYAYNTAEPLARFFYSSIIKSSLDLPLVLGIASILIVLLQSLWVNQIVVKYKIFDKEGFLPAIIYVVFLSMTPEFIRCSPALLSITFIIPVLDKLFEAYNKEECFKLIFDCGFLLGISSLFYFPCMFFLIFIFLSLGILRSFKIKEWLSVFVGLISAYILIFTVYYLFEESMFKFDNFGSLYSGKLLKEFSRINISIAGLAGIVVLSLMSFLYTSRLMTGSLIQYRKFMRVLLICGIIALLSIILPSNNHSYHLVLLMLPLSISFLNVFVNFSSSYISSILFFTLISFTLILQYLPYFYKL